MSSLTIQAAQIAGIASSFALFGFNFSSSLVVLPTIYKQPVSISTPIFTQIYRRGLRLAVSLSAIPSLSFAHLAYAVPEQRSLYAAGFTAILMVGAWTGIVMMPNIQKLIRISESSSAEQEKVSVATVEVMLKDWVGKNYIRSGFGLVGGLFGLYAAMK